MADSQPPTALPSVDDVLGAAPKLPSVDDLLGAPANNFPGQPGGSVMSGPGWDSFVTHSPIGRVLDAFGHGVAQGWGTSNLGLTPEGEQELQKLGIFPDVQKGQGGVIRALNEALIRPAAAGLDAVYRAGAAAFRGGQAGVAQAGAEVGQPALGRDIAALPEAFPMGAEGLTVHPEPPPTLPSLPEASRLGVIGKGEAGWDGTAPEPVRTPAADVAAQVKQAQADAANANQPGSVPSGYAPGALGEPSSAPPMAPYTAHLEPPQDVHEAARQIAPGTFAEYDKLSAQRDALRQQVQQQIDQLRTQAEAEAPHAAEIADLQARLEDTTPRLAKKYQERLASLIPERDAWLDENTADLFNHPSVAALRDQLMQTDYRMRDLAPEVSAAYQQAGKMFPEPAEAAPEPAPAPVAEEAASEQPETAAAPPEAVEAQPAPPQNVQAPAAQQEPGGSNVQAPVAAEESPGGPNVQAPAAEAPQPVNIAQDVAQKLVAAGRPDEEAQLAGALIEAHYQARAGRFGGARGTAEDLYAAEGPEIRAGGTGGRGGAAAGKLRMPEYAQGDRGTTAFHPRPILTLFAKADASTFLHETGHMWAEEMLRDADHPAAPPDLIRDARSVREWLGAKEGEPLTTRQHEKFARGFERYMMEGVAPSRALDAVFARFREWLTAIYQSVARLRAPISDDIRAVFDRMLAQEPQRAVVAPELPFEETSYSREPTPYQRMPKEPKRLIRFLTESKQIGTDVNAKMIPGGLRDEGGDVAAIVGGPKGRPGLINKGGQSLDEAAERAWQAGYLGTGARPSVNDLLDAIREDHAGNPVYSAHDEEQVQQFRAAMEHNAEIDRLASEHDIDPKGMTVEQFYEHVAEKASANELHEDIANIETEHETEFDEVAAELRDNAMPWPDRGEPVTLEDLENANRQEAAALANHAGSPDLTGSGRADGSADEGEAGGGSGSDGAGPSGRAGAQDGAAAGRAEAAGRSDQPTEPQQRFPERPDRLIDTAGNIRLDLLNAPEDVNDLLREMAGQHGDYMQARRGVVSDADALDMLNAMGATARELNIKALHRLVMNDPWPMTVRVRALRDAIVQQGTRVRAAMERAATGSDDDLAAFARESDRLNMIQETLSGVTAEWGRTGRAFHQREAGVEQASALAEFLKDNRGRTLYQMRQIAQRGMELETPAQLAKFTRDTARPGLFDWIQSAFINALLSGSLTHATYTVAGDIYAVFRSLGEGGAAAAIGTARRALGGEGGAEFGEIPRELFGLYRGAVNGTKAAWKAFKSGTPHLPPEVEAQPELPGTAPVARPGVIPGKVGVVLELPSRFVTAYHTLNWTTFYSQSIAGQAFRVAREEGLADAALDRRVAELIQSPTRQMIDRASQDAADGALMSRPEQGSLMQRVSDVTNWGIRLGDLSLPGGRTLPLGTLRPIKFIDPFVQIAGNIQRVALGRGTPLALFKSETRADLMGRNGPAAFDRTAGRILAGTSFMTAAGWLAAKGMLNGSGPTQPAQAAEWRRIHGLPHGLNIGDLSFDTLRLGPMGLQMSVAADLYHAAEHIGTEDAATIAGKLSYAFAQNLVDESFMRGPSEMIQATEDPARYGGRFVRNFVSSAFPFSVGLSQIAREIDPYSRDARTTMDAVLAKIPGESETLAPRYDVWGQPVENWKWAGTYYGHVQDDPLDRTLYGLGIYPSVAGRRIRGVQLTDQQYQDYARTSGRMMRMRLDALIRTPGFTALPRETQIDTIRHTVTGARETARDLVLMNNPGIVQQAVQAKRALALGAH